MLMNSNNFDTGIDPVQIKDWNDIILTFKDYSFFHTAEWCKILVDFYGFIPSYSILKANNSPEFIIPGMKVKNLLGNHKVVCLPYSDYSDPLVSSQCSIDQGWNYIAKKFVKERNSSFEIRTKFKLDLSLNQLEHDYLHLLKLESPDNMYKSFSHSVKGNISKARKLGVSIVRDNSEPALDEFYKLQCISRKRHGLPPQPIGFFRHLHNTLMHKDMADVFLAYYNNGVIASGMFLKFGKKVIFKFANSNVNFSKYRANNLIVWEAIKYYTNRGFELLDFGKAEAGNEGLRRFKKGYNADEFLIHRYFYSFKTGEMICKNSKQSKLVPYLFKFAPVSHLKIVGKLLYPYFG